LYYWHFDLYCIITSIIDDGLGIIIVTTSAPHGLLDGQFVNITGTTSYNQQRLVISNVSALTFEVQITFAGDESGFFDTGVESVTIDEIDLTNDAFDNPLFDITLANSFAPIFAVDRITAIGFTSPGIIRGGNIGFNLALLPFVFNGLTIENAANLSMREVLIPSLLGIPGAIAVTVTGSATGRVVIDSTVFDLAEPGEFPMRIDPSITSAIINITNSPDNGVATDYFDLSAGGLDETDPRIITLSNGSRKDSMFIGGFFHTNNIAVTTILDGTFSPLNLSTGGGVTAFVENERFNVFTANEGVLEYTGLGEKTVTLIGVLSIIKTGSNGDYNLRYVIDHGEIDIVAVVLGGTGYVDAESVTLTGVTSGATNATATISVTGGVITAINIVSGGSQYTAGETVNVIGGSGSGATGTATILGFVALPTPIERTQTISTTSRDTTLNQSVVLDEGDKIRIEIEGMGTADSITVIFASLDIKG